MDPLSALTLLAAIVIVVFWPLSMALTTRSMRKTGRYYVSESEAIFENILMEEDDDERRIRLSNFRPTFLSEKNYERRAAMLHTLTIEYASTLLRRARENNDGQALLRLIGLIKKECQFSDEREKYYLALPLKEQRGTTRYFGPYYVRLRSSRHNHLSYRLYSQSEYQKSTGVDFDYPEDWNDLVARLLPNPSLDQFVLGGNTWVTGDFRRKAVEAIETRSLTLAKILLAFVNSRWDVERELGSQAAELARFVVPIDIENGIAHPASATT